MSETNISQLIRLALSRIGVKMFRNNVGQAWQGKVIPQGQGSVLIVGGRLVKYGLFNGSGDLIGWRSLEITPDMVGKKIAQFVSVEVKSAKGKASAEQRTWRDAVNNAGGLAGIAKTEQEATKLFE